MGTVKVNGAHRKLVGVWTKVDGAWRQVSEVSGKENGAWKDTWKNNFPKPSFLSYPTTITRGQTITVTTENIDGADYLLQVSYNGGAWVNVGTSHPNPAMSVTISTNTSYVDVKFRVCAVEPATLDKQSTWMEGPTRSLSAQQLSQPTGLSYPAAITRGDKVRITWNGVIPQGYNLYATYNDGNNNLKEVLVYANYPNVNGAFYVDYNVESSTTYKYLLFKIKTVRSGYQESEWAIGPTITLTAQKLAYMDWMDVPTPVRGQTITISWKTIPNAVNYLLEVKYDSESTFTRVYFGPNKSVNYTVAHKSTIQFRIKAQAPNYIDADWRNAWTNPIATQAPPLKSSTWAATLTKSWRPNFGGQYHPDNNYVYQGGWNDGTYWGDYTGLAFFDSNSIRNTLAGKTIEKVQVYFYRINSGGYASGQAINLHTHNYTSVPSATAGRPATSHAQGPFSSYARGEGKWITVSKVVAERIRDGQAAGIALYNGGSNYLYMSSNVQLYVEYR